MRRLAVLLAALSVLVIAPVDTASAANRTPGCITKYEFSQVTKGTPEWRARRVIGARGRTTSYSSFSDGDAWKTIEFRQCRRTWRLSSVAFNFEKTEKRVWVEDLYCDSWGCEDWGGYETVYRKPFRMQSKYAYWS